MKNIVLTSICLLLAFTSFSQNTDSTKKTRAFFGELKGEGPYKRSDVILQDRITVSSADGNHYEVVSFRLIIAPKAGTAILLSCSNSLFSESIKQSLYKVELGDKIIVEAIQTKVNGAEDNMVQLEPLIFVIGDRPNKVDNDAYDAHIYERNNKENDSLKVSKPPYALFGSIDVSDATASYTFEDIQAQTEILTKEGGLTFKVTRFKMILAFKEAPAVMMTSAGNQLTEQMKEAITKLKTGDRILIEGITATTEHKGETYKANLSPIIITIP